MFRDKGLHRLLRPRRPNAVRQIEGPRDLAAKAVDIQRYGAHGRIGQRRLQLRGNPFVDCQA